MLSDKKSLLEFSNILFNSNFMIRFTMTYNTSKFKIIIILFCYSPKHYQDNFLSFVTMIVLVFTIVIFFSPYGYRTEGSNVIDFDRILTEVVIKRFEASGIEIPNQVGLLKYTTCFANVFKLFQKSLQSII